MSKGFLPKYSKHKLKVFFFFLVVASIFWVLTKFSREFTTNMVAKIEYENLPETTALAKSNPETINFDLTANGFEILFYKFKKPALQIDVSRYYEKDKKSFVLSRNELMRILSSSFNKYMEIKNLSLDQLKVMLDPIILKKVPVKPQIDVSFKDGFKAIDSIKTSPDSITISGPQESIGDIKFVRTEKLTLKDVEKNISEKIKVVRPSEAVVAMKPESVQVTWEVAEFSQGKFTLPVEIINLPPGIELKLVPPRVTISFDVPIDEFTGVLPENFHVVCDYAKRNNEENFMLPKLSQKPKAAMNIVFEPKKIDYLIVK